MVVVLGQVVDVVGIILTDDNRIDDLRVGESKLRKKLRLPKQKLQSVCPRGSALLQGFDNIT